MSQKTMIQPVIKKIDVPCAPDTAFRIFTEDLGSWWPRQSHSVSAQKGQTARAVTLEPRAGGAISETGHDGTHYDWGTVKTYDPVSRLSLLWHIERPVEEATIVDVLFEPINAGTRVTLTHHGWEALNADAQSQRDSYNSGWVGVFETAFAEACRADVA